MLACWPAGRNPLAELVSTSRRSLPVPCLSTPCTDLEHRAEFAAGAALGAAEKTPEAAATAAAGVQAGAQRALTAAEKAAAQAAEAGREAAEVGAWRCCRGLHAVDVRQAASPCTVATHGRLSYPPANLLPPLPLPLYTHRPPWQALPRALRRGAARPGPHWTLLSTPPSALPPRPRVRPRRRLPRRWAQSVRVGQGLWCSPVASTFFSSWTACTKAVGAVIAWSGAEAHLQSCAGRVPPSIPLPYTLPSLLSFTCRRRSFRCQGPRCRRAGECSGEGRCCGADRPRQGCRCGGGWSPGR